MKIRLLNLGRIQYGKALDLQLSLKQDVLSNRGRAEDTRGDSSSECLITCQHDPPVYTVGNRSEIYAANEEHRLRSLGADYFATKRGGLVTFHGPGQLICYPILDIKNRKIPVRKYARCLEEIIVRVCAKFAIPTEVFEDPLYTGVWVKGTSRKICALGVNASGGVTTHGVALNVNTDLSWFNKVVPCGLTNCGVTSLVKETANSELSVPDVLPFYLEEFRKEFDVDSFVM